MLVFTSRPLLFSCTWDNTTYYIVPLNCSRLFCAWLAEHVWFSQFSQLLGKQIFHFKSCPLAPRFLVLKKVSHLHGHFIDHHDFIMHIESDQFITSSDHQRSGAVLALDDCYVFIMSTTLCPCSLLQQRSERVLCSCWLTFGLGKALSLTSLRVWVGGA